MITGKDAYACWVVNVTANGATATHFDELEQITRDHWERCAESLRNIDAHAPAPVSMLLWCPVCGERHVDVGEFATKAHHTHACQHCGMVWRPALVPTVGVDFLPGFKDKET